jgi:hypothetical protein
MFLALYRQAEIYKRPLSGGGLHATPMALVGPLLGDLAHMNMACPNKRLNNLRVSLLN